MCHILVNDFQLLICNICDKEVKSRRPFNNERWYDHIKTKGHLSKMVSTSTNQRKISELFLPVSLSTDPLPVMNASCIMTHTAKVCLGIHPGNKNLKIMKSYGKHDDLNIFFTCELNGENVKAVHMECVGKCIPVSKKTQTIKSCKMSADVHRKKIFYKRLSCMTKVQMHLTSLPCCR